MTATTVDFDRIVDDLAIEQRAHMAAGTTATPAVRRGLRHAVPAVRARCCAVLDHFLDADAIPELVENLDHEDPWVRMGAIHALGCDRCKEGECRPMEHDVIAA